MTNPELNAPQTVDVNLAGICNLDCPWCWGPLHELDLMLPLDSWKEILYAFQMRGTKGIVDTGGEPLLIPETEEFLRYAKEVLQLHTTLSTNGMLHNKLRTVLPYLDEVGIPLDGSTVKKNTMMRLNQKHFDMAIEAMTLVKDWPSHVHLTTRTVVSKVNQTDIRNIGKLLAETVKPDRWKLYQFTPTGGYGQQARYDHEISDDLFLRTVGEVQAEFPQLNIAYLSRAGRAGRYVFIMPNGNVSTVGSDGVTYTHLGNAHENIEEVMDNFTRNTIAQSHLTHGLLGIE